MTKINLSEFCRKIVGKCRNVGQPVPDIIRFFYPTFRQNPTQFRQIIRHLNAVLLVCYIHIYILSDSIYICGVINVKKKSELTPHPHTRENPPTNNRKVSI